MQHFSLSTEYAQGAVPLHSYEVMRNCCHAAFLQQGLQSLSYKA